MGGCQNSGAFLGTLSIRCRIIAGTPIGTIILTTTQLWAQNSKEKLSPSQILDLLKVQPNLCRQLDVGIR